MGKNKRGYNWKARTNTTGTIDNSETLKLASKVDLPNNANNIVNISSDFDGSNTLVLPSKKRKFKSHASNEPIGKILSKKKRKLLEKVVDRKKKREERGDLLEKLESVQADAALLDKMVSLSSVQTKGIIFYGISISRKIIIIFSIFYGKVVTGYFSISFEKIRLYTEILTQQVELQIIKKYHVSNFEKKNS